MPYRVDSLAKARRALDRLPVGDRDAVLQALAELGSNPRPHGSRKLAGRNPAWRVRVGNIRVVYAIFDADQRGLVGLIERRSERTYRDIDILFR